MYRIAIFFLAVSFLLAAEDSWTKVGKLKTGTELRIFKKGAKQPVLAKMDEANDERLVVILKNEQVAIPKDDIERIDYRPAQTSRITKESRTVTKDEAPMPGNPQSTPGPNTSTSSSVSIGSKPDFETIYRRLATLPKQ